MRYRKLGENEKTSLLGMGCMRFPLNRDRSINYDKAAEIIDYVYTNGVNYYDTAYIYNDGESETVTGRALQNYPRDSFYLATKLPPMACNSAADVYKLFDIQTERLRTDYFDFYLFHHLHDGTYAKANEGYIIPALLKLREQGRIRRLGFSAHCGADLLKKFLGEYDWDFVQLQINYFDWDYQKMSEQYSVVEDSGLPLIVMEPIRGGRLASLTPGADKILKAAAPDRSVSSWALRWVAKLPQVQVILSGMSTLEQAIDNVSTLSRETDFSADEEKALADALDIFKQQSFVPCTGCNYCSGCPSGLDIPRLIGYYNEANVSLGFFRLLEAFRQPKEKRAHNCVKCGVCAEKCPQGIDIPAVLRKLADEMDADKFHNR